jgi:chromosome segregation ATPase
MKLSLHKDDTYQESLSKIISIKSFIEKTISKINEKNKNRNIHNNNDNSILKIESLQELLTLNNDKNTTDIIKHIIKLINKYFKNENESIISKTNNENNKDEYKINVEQLGNKSEILKFEQIINELINIIYKLKKSYIEEKGKNEKLMNEISEKDKLIEAMNNNTNSDINNLKTELENEKKKILEQMEELNKKYEDKEKEYDLLKEENNRLIQEISQCKENEQNSSEKNLKFEDDLKVKDEKILDLEKINSELNNKINELNKKINELNNKITELEKKKNNNIDINKVMKDSDIIKMVNNYDVQLKKLGNDLMNKNKDELRDLENKLKNLESKYEMIVLERESLKKNIIYLKGKKYDPDSYEEVLKEQFETMRNAFTQKIDDLNEELNDVKRDSRVRIYNLELELKENVRLKNNFLKQIISLQSQLDSLNQ